MCPTPEASPNERPKVLVAIEPRAYRDAIGRVVGDLRPSLDVRVVQPEELGGEVERLAPQLVLCSGPEPPGPVSDERYSSWVDFRPYGAKPKVRIRVGDRCWGLEDADLEDLLFLVDEATRVFPREVI